MGIITDPGYELYVAEKTDCYEEGKAPKKLYCRISGVQRGEAWTPECGTTMNGCYILEWQHTYVWTWANGNCSITLNLMRDTTQLRALNEIPRVTFECGTEEGCAFEGEANCQDPLMAFYGGGMTLTQREPGSTKPSIKTTCNLIGIEPEKKTFVEIHNTDTLKRVFRLARQRDGTCIKIKTQ